jgi:hypothetical protein
MNCGQCEHFLKTTSVGWGECCAPIPAWLDIEGCQSKRYVCAVDGHQNNHADDCDTFIAKDLEAS